MPKIKSNTLILITGIIWLIASLILISRVYSWAELMTSKQLMAGIILVVPLASIKIYFIFHQLTINNIKRIQSFEKQNVSVWKFHLPKDKLIILLMILVGIGLRSAPFIPNYILFPIYLGIGIAMIYVCLLYLSAFLKQKIICFRNN